MGDKRQQLLWPRTAILLAMFALALTSLGEKSPTFDEQGFLTRGIAYLRGENRRIRVGHPLGLNALNGLFLSVDDQVELPTEDPSWQGSNFHRPSELFLWEIGNDVGRVMFLGRLPTIWLGMLLVAVAGRWAREISANEAAALLAMVLLALDPNILANTRLATTDLGLAAAALLAGYMLWRFWQEPGWVRAMLAGGAFGLLLNTKFTAGLFVPLFAVVILVSFVEWWRKARGEGGTASVVLRPLMMLVVCYPLAGFVVLWASNGFQVGTLPSDLPTLSRLAGTRLPLSHYFEQLLDIGGRMQKVTPTFLWGAYSDSGWWYYFPVAFVLKTPLPTLILLLWASARLVLCALKRLGPRRCLTAVDAVALLTPAAGYFAFALMTDINLGYRHLLPILPFLAVFIGIMISRVGIILSHSRKGANVSRLAITGLLIWLGLSTLWVYPHFLSYFNVLAGGPAGGWRFLVDSNLDWGQDLAGLKPWMEENDVDEVWLSYFGEARPDYYGINYRGLDSMPPRLMNPQAQPFYPADPAPGHYAISATNLQGVHFQDKDQFAWFRTRDPMDKIGNSIFVYEVPATGERIEVTLGNLQLSELNSQDFARWSSNDVSAHWFDASQSFLQPQSERIWLALSKDVVVHPRVEQELSAWEMVGEQSNYRLYRRPAGNKLESESRALFERDSNEISLIEAAIKRQALAAGDELALETRWYKDGTAEPIKIFVHVTGDDGDIIAQWDGLGAVWEGWQDGDVLLQLHQIKLPETIAPGAYQVWAGLYDPETGIRWQTEGEDRFLLEEIVVGQ